MIAANNRTIAIIIIIIVIVNMETITISITQLNIPFLYGVTVIATVIELI